MMSFLHQLRYRQLIEIPSPDILLHQSGHIMLTDFDLSKGSHPPGKPCVVKSNSPNVVGTRIFFLNLF
jgi:hypothetical protein